MTPVDLKNRLQQQLNEIEMAPETDGQLPVIPGAAPPAVLSPGERTLAEISRSRVLEFSTSLDRNNPDQQNLFVSCAQTSDKNAADHLDEWFDVRHVLMQRCEIVSRETGEVEYSTRTVFIAPDGTSLDCWSDLVCSGLNLIVGMIGPPPFGAGRQFRIVQKKGRGKNRKYVLETRLNPDVLPPF